MIHALLLASAMWGQDISTPTATVNVIDQMEFQNLSKAVRELQSGRPTITGVPYFINGTTVGTPGVTFGDGTTQTTAASAAAVLVSTCTRLLINQGTTSTAWVAVTGSTVTATFGAKRLLVIFSGQVGNSVGGNHGMVTVTMDGAYLNPIYTASFGCASHRNSSGGENVAPFTCAILTDVVSAGSHSVTGYFKQGTAEAETARFACGNDGTIQGARCLMCIIETSISS